MDTSREHSGSEMWDGQHFIIVEIRFLVLALIVVMKYLIIRILFVLSMDMPGVKMHDGSHFLVHGSKMERGYMDPEYFTTLLQVV